MLLKKILIFIYEFLNISTTIKMSMLGAFDKMKAIIYTKLLHNKNAFPNSMLILTKYYRLFCHIQNVFNNLSLIHPNLRCCICGIYLFSIPLRAYTHGTRIS